MTSTRKSPDLERLLEHAAWLRRLAYGLVHDASGADELVQDTWAAALRSPPSVDRPVRPWLRRVITNVARMRWRGERNRRTREHATMVGEDSATPSTHDLLERHETQQLLARLVSELEEPFRETILLRYGEGLSPSAIARRLGIPAGTVRSRTHEALERLRVRLDSAHRGDRRAWVVVLAAGARRPATPAWPVLAWTVVAAILVGVAAATWRRAPAGDRANTTSGIVAAAPTDSHATMHPTVDSDAPGWMSQPNAPRRRIAGIITVDGSPAKDALVRLTSELSRSGIAPVIEQRTGGDGRFDFGPQVARVFDVGASTPGTLAAVDHVDLRDPTDRPAPDALELRLGPCRAALYGTVTDAAGTPIGGAELLREDVIGTRSGENGHYEICLPPVASSLEELRLFVHAAGFGALMIDVGLAGRERHDFILTPEAVLDGVARGRDGTPVPHARIWIERADAAARRETEQPARLLTATDESGRFHFEGLSGGRHRLGGAGPGARAAPVVIDVRAAGARSVELVMEPTAMIRGRVERAGVPVAGALVEVEGEDNAAARSQIDGTFVLDSVPLGKVELRAAPYRVRSPATTLLVTGDRSDVILDVEPLGQLSGIVRHHGEPVSGARVCATPTSAPGTCGHADAAGRYELDGLVPGDYWAFADETGVGAGAHDLWFALGLGEHHALDIDLREGGQITGVVVDRSGSPVVGATVRLASTNPLTQGDRSRCVTAMDGRFDCGNLAGVGSYEVAVFSGPGQTLAFPFAGPSPLPIKLSGGDSRVDGVRLVVDSTMVELRGVVVDAAGVPVSDARVNAWGTGSDPPWLEAAPTTATDPDGRFRLPRLAPGTYTLEVRTSDGFRSAMPGVVAGTRELRLVVDRALCKNPELAPEADPIRAVLLHAAPPAMSSRPPSRIVWDGRIELMGWDLPPRVELGKPFELTLYYKVLDRIDRPWKVFVHIDGPVRAGRADHEPIGGRCEMTEWQPGDYVVDRYTAKFERSERAKPGTYDVWVGFFTGYAPSWKNMPISDAPADRRDQKDRVKLSTIRVD